MHVLVLTPYLYDMAPGPRSSIELWQRVLEPAGVFFDYAPFEDEALHRVIYQKRRLAGKAGLLAQAYLRRISTVRNLEDYDAVWYIERQP